MIVSYKMLIAGAMLGVIGNFTVSTWLYWYEKDWIITNFHWLLPIVSVSSIFLALFLITKNIEKLTKNNK